MNQEIIYSEENSSKTVRPPIVVVMGHIDHGKSMILETIRKIKMLEQESGGITQHIGAYEVKHNNKKITFIDTPGHEAFSKMRSRGAKVADIAILVVAADEGVKAQTKEAITIIQENNLAFIVALNKIDKPEANAERVKQELAQENVLVESYGGKIPLIEISAKTGKNIDELLEILLLMAEIAGLEANIEKPAEGVVIEAHLDPRRGITTTLLTRDGMLFSSDTLVIGRSIENIKILEDFRGNPIKEAGPSSPVLITGLAAIPLVGEIFRAFKNKKGAAKFISTLAAQEPLLQKTLESREESAKPIFNIVLKTDVAGSLEVLEEELKKLKSESIGIRIIHSGVGDINESDVKHAMATRLVTIIGFKVKTDPTITELARSVNIRIITGDTIYEVIDGVKKHLMDMIPPEIKRTELGKSKILKVFKKDGSRQIVGGRVEEGTIKKGGRMDIKRNREIIGNGTILQLQQAKQDVEEVAKGFEFGIMTDSKTTIQEGDVLEIYQEELINKIL